MTTLSKAPLVEVATQIRWGVMARGEDGDPLNYSFSEDEQKGLPAEFSRVLASAGYSHMEDFAPELDDVQFSVSRRYRPGPDEWPVLQTGLGVMVVNQTNDRYDWGSYKESVLTAADLLRGALANFYDDPPFIGVELMYFDAFPLADDEQPLEFLRRNFKVQLVPPAGFLGASFVSKSPTSASLSFVIDVTKPVGSLSMSLSFGEAVGRPAYMMDTRVLSVRPEVGFSHDDLNGWMESAHEVQQHAFRTLIKPAYRRSFR